MVTLAVLKLCMMMQLRVVVALLFLILQLKSVVLTQYIQKLREYVAVSGLLVVIVVLLVIAVQDKIAFFGIVFESYING